MNTRPIWSQNAFQELRTALVWYLLDPLLRQTHGSAAHERVVAEFAQARVWRLWAEAYSAKLAERGLPLPEAFR